MNFSQLQSFITVVQLHSFSKAAERLHFSQSTITSHINELEKELGQQLLVRSTRNFQLTKAGIRCYSFAVAVVSRKNALLCEFNKNSQIPKILRIVASSLPLHSYLPKVLTEYNSIHPNIFLKIVPSDSYTIAESMKEHQVHIAFCGYETKNKNYIYSPIAKDQLVVITPDNAQYQTLEQKNPFPEELLLSQPMICRAPISGTRLEFEKYLTDRGIYTKPNVICEMPDAFSIINSVSEGLGIAVLSSFEVRQITEKKKLLCFSLENLPCRSLYIVKQKHDKLLSYEREFYDYVLEQAKYPDKK